MRRIVLAVMSTVAAVVVLFGYRTSTAHPAVATVAAAAGSGGTGTTTPGVATTPAAPSTSPTAAAATAGPTTASVPAATVTARPTATATARPTATATATTTKVTGTTAQTQWGPVQIQLTITAGKITAVTALQLPSQNGRDVEINDYAVPVLVQETLQAQSAQIDSVSGATYTSEGYLTSLQSALDQAGL